MHTDLVVPESEVCRQRDLYKASGLGEALVGMFELQRPTGQLQA
jgi:hypothetical protein